MLAVEPRLRTGVVAQRELQTLDSSRTVLPQPARAQSGVGALGYGRPPQRTQPRRAEPPPGVPREAALYAGVTFSPHSGQVNGARIAISRSTA